MTRLAARSLALALVLACCLAAIALLAIALHPAASTANTGILATQQSHSASPRRSSRQTNSAQSDLDTLDADSVDGAAGSPLHDASIVTQGSTDPFAIPPHDPHHHAPTAATTVQAKRILIGIFTTASKLQRRAIIRATYLRDKPSTIDVFFVVGRPASQDDATLLAFESSLHSDIMVVNCTENMDDGKTYTYFRHVAHSFANGTYAHVMKVDDDAWLHLRNLDAWVASLPQRGVYFGFEIGQAWFMGGMGYGVSWDLAVWISRDAWVATSIKGQEDAVVEMWLKASGLLEHWKSQTTSAFYEDPKYGGIWSHAYTPDTILIHRLKNDSWFLAPSRHFMPQLMDASLLGYM